MIIFNIIRILYIYAYQIETNTLLDKLLMINRLWSWETLQSQRSDL